MLLYVINVEACIHEENYRIFFYEPVANKQLELFEASWELTSLTKAFREVAANMNRRGFENREYQVLVCVRRRESDRWRETTLFAKALVCQALERSGAIPVITGSFTRKVTVLFQVEQPYFGTVPRTSVWEEELAGINRFLELLEIGSLPDHAGCSGGYVPDLWGRRSAGEWETALAEALDRESGQKTDPVTGNLKERLRLALEEEKETAREQEEEAPDTEELPDSLLFVSEDEQKEEGFDYISHRIRSLLDGSGLNRCTEVIYWPVPREMNRANRVSMLSLVDLLRFGEEVTREKVQEYFGDRDPEFETRLLARYRRALAGYRMQLQQKHDRILQENEIQEEEARPPLSLSLPEISSGLSERIESARQQLESCRVSLKRSKRKEVRERVDEIGQSLTDSLDGLEEELLAYERQVTDCLYREIEGHPHIGFETAGRETGTKDQAQEDAAARDEQAGKAMIRQWKQEMKQLTDCAELTGPKAAIAYLLIVLIIAWIPWLVYQGDALASGDRQPIVLAVFGILVMGLAVKRCLMPGYFIRSIASGYTELEKKLTGVLDCYQDRAEGFEECVAEWLRREHLLQSERSARQKKKDTSELAAMRAWHLANIQKTIAGLETFQTMEEGWSQPTEHPEITRRILQPMEYRKKELENIVYWPVIEKEERRQSHE